MLCILGALLFTQACSSIAYVQLNDRVPAKAAALAGKRLSCLWRMKGNPRTSQAQESNGEFDHFSETISYSVQKGTKPVLKMGLYDVPSLVKEAFRVRVESEGVEPLSERRTDQIELVLGLQDFSLDLVSRNWKVKFGYEVRLIKKRSTPGQAIRQRRG